MPLSLHVFEERYKEMMRDCMAASTSFGVVAVREGLESSGAAVPHAVGTLARIVHLEELSDGRINLLVTGASRFRVGPRLDGKPYARAEVDYLAEEDGAATPQLTRRVKAAFRGYLRSLSRVSSGQAELPELPSEPEILSYLVAATMEIGLDARQQVLEAPDAATRMRLELGVLRREQDLLSRLVLPTSVVPGAFSRN